MLRILAEGHEAVALGGGAVLSPAVREALAGHTVVWMRVAATELWRRASRSGRPLARDEAEFMRLHSEREAIYRELADAIMLSADAVPDALDSLRALAGAPADRLIWAQSDSGSYPVWVGDGVLGMSAVGGPGPRVLRHRHERRPALPGRRGSGRGDHDSRRRGGQDDG